MTVSQDVLFVKLSYRQQNLGKEKVMYAIIQVEVMVIDKMMRIQSMDQKVVVREVVLWLVEESTSNLKPRNLRST